MDRVGWITYTSGGQQSPHISVNRANMDNGLVPGYARDTTHSPFYYWTDAPDYPWNVLPDGSTSSAPVTSGKIQYQFDFELRNKRDPRKSCRASLILELDIDQGVGLWNYPIQ